MKHSRLPLPGRWRRKVLASIGVLASLPLLFAAAVVSAATLAPFVVRAVDAVWPWVAGFVAVVLLWRLVVRRF